MRGVAEADSCSESDPGRALIPVVDTVITIVVFSTLIYTGWSMLQFGNTCVLEQHRDLVVRPWRGCNSLRKSSAGKS